MAPLKPFRQLNSSYLDPNLTTNAFSISGVSILVQAADRTLRQLIKKHWGPLEVSSAMATNVQSIFQFSDHGAGPLPRLKRWQWFTNEHFLLLSDGKRYLITGYMYDRPWQFHCRSLPGWDPEFIYYYVFEPILLDVLKKAGILVWHSAAVARDGVAILLPGVSGSGKSTTTLNLLRLGYQFLGDDMVLLRQKGDGLEVSGFETGLFLTDRSLELLPEWKKFKRGRRLKKGQRWKYRIELATKRPKVGTKPPLAKVLLFPHVTRGQTTRLEKLTETEALLECLRQEPKEFPASIMGGSSLESQFEIYSRLVRSKRCYRLHLGSNQSEVRDVLSRV